MISASWLILNSSFFFNAVLLPEYNTSKIILGFRKASSFHPAFGFSLDAKEALSICLKRLLGKEIHNHPLFFQNNFSLHSFPSIVASLPRYQDHNSHPGCVSGEG